MSEIFKVGSEQGIMDILQSKDERVAYQHQLLNEYPTKSILAIKLNIPGPIKNNQYLTQLFNAGLKRFLTQIKSVRIVEQWHKPTGNEAFATSNRSADQIKAAAIQFEDEDQLGRLFDIDVFGHDSAKAISRKELGFQARKCFICGRPAKECARSRRHSVPELQRVIQQKYNQEFGE